MAKLSETTARTTIGMMRSMASHKPISPFHLMAADEMEQLLEERKTTRNDTLEEVAIEFEKMKVFEADTMASIAVHIRSMKK
jgi:hypothetical protein